MLSPSPPTSALADSALLFLIQFPAKVHVFGEWKGNPKHPLAKGGFSTATNDRDEIERRCANPAAMGYCIYPGDGLMVIDLDVGDGKDGRKELAKLAAEHGEKLPQTAYVNSPRGNGSRHLYLRTPKGVVIPSSNGKIAPGIDVRGNDGAYWIAGPGSRTAKGEYKWERGPEHIIDAPEWLIEAANAARPRVRERSKPKTLPQCVTWDYPPNIERFTAWLKNEAKPSIDGQDGNCMLAATGAMGSSYALYEETTIQLMAEHWNERCEPPWDDDDLEYHGGSGYRSADHVGNMAARDHSTTFKPYVATENGEPVNDPDARYHELVRHFEGVLAASGGRARRAIRFGDILPLSERPGARWAIDKWLPRNATNALFGESEAFKTYVTLNMLLCVATGTSWGAYKGFEGYRVDGPRDVILFAGEGYDDVLDRFDAAIEGGGFNRELVKKHLIVVSDVYTLNRADGLAGMADEIEVVEARPAVIAVDTYNLALEGNEDGSEEAKRALRGLRALATMYDAAGLVLHHPGWGDKKRPRGSSAFRTNSDVMILCERVPGAANIASLTQYKNRFADPTRYRAALVGKPVDLGVYDDAGKMISNLAFSPMDPSAVPSDRDDTGAIKIGTANVYAEALAEGLLAAPHDKNIVGTTDATKFARQWMEGQGDLKVPAATTYRKWLSEVRDATRSEPAYTAAYLIHSRDPLKFSHPDRQGGVKREPCVSANGLFREQKGGD